MTFKTWIKKYISHDTPIGDLAKDIASDKKFPSSNNKDVLSDYLISQGCCSQVLSLFKEAFSLYQKDNLL